MPWFRDPPKQEPLASYVGVAFFGLCAAIAWISFLHGEPVPVIVLLGAPLMLAVSGFAAYIARRDALRAERIAQGLCPMCGYDLRGQTVRCPECGQSVDHSHES